MLRKVPRPVSVALFWCALACVFTGLSLLPAYSRAPAPVAPKTVAVDLGGDVRMEFVLIPKGKYMRGSPKDEKERRDDEVRYEVEITKPFYLAKYPVTQEQYLALIGMNPSYFCKDGEGADKVKNLDTKQFPVEMVSWDDAQTFCMKLTEKDKHQRKFRLPTEAQWEYACRAGTTTPFSFGSALNGKQANCVGRAPYGTTDVGPDKKRTTKVGEYGENKWGLCDMHGNVWQWCEDYYGPHEELNQRDPLQAFKDSEGRRVLRGGSWIHAASDCRAAHRDCNAPAHVEYDVGFRVAFRLD